MATRTGALIVLFAGIVLAGGSLAAQMPQDGDCVVLGQTVGPVSLGLSWYSHDGKNTGSLFNSGMHSWGAGLCAAPGQNGVLFTCVFNPTVSTIHLMQVDRWRSVSTLSTLSTAIQYVPVIRVDQTGDLWLLNQTTVAALGGIYRTSGTGGNLRTLINGIANAVAMEEDLLTGNLLVADMQGDVHHVTRQGLVTSVTRGAFPASTSVQLRMHTDFRDGSVLAAWVNHVFRFHPGNGIVQTLITGGATSTYVALDHDPYHGRFYRGDGNGLYRYDPATGQSTLLQPFPGGLYAVADVATWGSRILTGQGAARPGAAYSIAVSLWSEAGRGYQAAASFGTLAGIPTPAGRIPLDPDALFFLSLANPVLFQNFSGYLSRSGTANLTVILPTMPQLRGLRFFVAAITWDSQGIRCISEPLGVSIE